MNWADPLCYGNRVHPMVQAAIQGHVMTLNDAWRTAPLVADHKVWRTVATTVLAQQFDTISSVMQVYARTMPAICAQVVATVARILEGIDGAERLRVSLG